MKISNEVKVGALAVVAISLLIWGYNFLKGKNLFKASSSYYVEYQNIDGLATSAQVYISGLQVGVVSDLYFKQNAEGNLTNTIVAVIDLNRGITIPKNTKAVIISPGLMGAKAVSLEFENACSGPDCAIPGDYLIGDVQGMLEAFTGNIDPYLEKAETIFTALDSMFNNFSNGNGGKDIEKSLKDFQNILANLSNTSKRLDVLLANSTGKIDNILTNVNSMTQSLNSSNQDIKNIIANASQITNNLKNIQLDGTVNNANQAIDNVKTTLVTADQSLKEIQTLLNNINQSNGTLAKVINEKELYDNLNQSLLDLDLLLKDFRLNPKRYIHVSVFGKDKSKDNMPLNQDPGIQMHSKDN